MAGVLVLGAGGYAVADLLAGGGQPEDVLPVDTLGFVRIDLDPSLGQQMALASLLGRFPEAAAELDGDLREELLAPLLDVGGTGLTYGSDVEPWLGDAMALAAVPAPESDSGAAPVLVLEVSDEDRMRAALTRAQAGAGLGFAVRGDHVLVTATQERADALAAAPGTLADDPRFAADLEALGRDQIALAWADLSALEDVLAAGLGPEVATGNPFDGSVLSGRAILGVHAEDDALEMTALGFDAPGAGRSDAGPTGLVQELPAETLAAVSLAGVGDLAVAAWDRLEATGALAGAEESVADLGLDLGLDVPEDLRTILGTDLTVAVLGDPLSPQFGARAATEQPQEATRLVDAALDSSGLGPPAVSAQVDGGYVVASDQATLDALVAGGDLGSTARFRAAVADAATASAIGFVDLAAVLDGVVAAGGPDAAEAARYSALEAVGFSATQTEEGQRVVLRITVR